MFGEESLLFYTTVNIDAKNRVAIPIKSLVEENDVLALVQKKDEDHLSIYNVTYYDSLLKELFDLRRIAFLGCNDEEYKKRDKQIKQLSAEVLDKVKVQKQNRIILSDYIIKKFDLKKELHVGGEYDHINIFNSEESYENYKKFVKKRS